MMSDVRYEIKRNFITLLSDLKHWLEKKPGRFVSTNTNTNWSWFQVGWSGRWWRLKRSSTNWSFFSKWSWNWLRRNPGPQTSGFSSTLCRDSWFANFGLQLDFRVETPFVQFREILSFSSIHWSRLLSSGPDFVSGIVSSIVSSLVSRLVFTQYEPK